MTKKKDLFDLAMENVEISSGIMIGSGVVSNLGTIFPSDSSTKIIAGMEPLAIFPTLHATKGVFTALDDMNARFKRKHK